MRPLSILLTTTIFGAAAAAFVPIATRAQTMPSASASPIASATTAASPTASKGASSTVDTKNFVYTPGSLTVTAGSTVVFKNSDTTAHTVTAADGSFDSKNMDKDQTWSHVFAKAGTYAYVCAYHAFMKGTIVVK